MAPKIKTSPDVYVVVSSTGVDSVHVTIESAKKRATTAKSEGSTNVRTEVHEVIGGKAQIDPEKPDDAVVKAKPEVKAVAPLAQIDKLKDQIGDAATPPKDAQAENAKSEAKSAEPKAKDAQPAASDPKESKPKDAKDSKPKESKPKESKAKEPKAKESKPKEPKSESKAKEPKASKPKEPKSETKAKDAKPKEPKTDSKPEAKPTDNKESATPSKTPSKTISAEEQRATNAKKGTKAADEDLPANVQALLSSTSDALDGLTVVVTGVPPTIGRKNAEKLVTGHGGKLGKSITGRTDLVVLGNDAGPKKLEQIKDLAVETMDEDALIKTLENGGGSVAAKKKRSAAAVSDEDAEDGNGKAKKVKK